MMKQIGIIGLVWIMVQTSLSAQNVIIDDAVPERILALEQLEYFIDDSNTLSFDEVLQLGDSFRVRQDLRNQDYKLGASYWVRLHIKHDSQSEKRWLLEFYDQTIDHLEAFMPQPDGSYKRFLMGDTYDFGLRTFRHKNFELLVDLQQDFTYTYYFRVISHDFADIRIAFRSVDRFVSYALSEYYLYGMFYGMIIIISLYNLLVYLAIKEIKNIYYIIYILSVAIYAMCIDGIAFQYLWPGHPEWNQNASGIALYSVILWALIFTRRFLNTKSTSPFLDKMLIAAIWLRTALFILSLFWFPYWLGYRNIEIIPLSIIFYAGIRVWLNGYRPARFFVMAYGLLFLGFLLRGLVYLEVLPFTIISHYSLHLSFLVEMLLLTFALGDRIRILKANRDRAMQRIIKQHEVNVKLKDKVNRELEMKVKERTLELEQQTQIIEESNKKLIKQATEINQINSILDLENWKLKNNIKEVMTDRLMEKTLSYDEFKTLYPDKLACYRFLEEHKWTKGYHCHKCENDKYFDGVGKFDRRCTRCGYNESITAYTLFHAIKFPIEKAFYIAYVAVAYRKGFTLEELAEKMDMRVNTVWNFRKKVIDQVEYFESKGHRVSTAKWQDVIMVAPNGHAMVKRATSKPKVV